MDWRTRLRTLVNREYSLDPLRSAVIRVVDPIEWYMRKKDDEESSPRRPRRRVQRGWTYSPLGEVEPRPPSSEDIERRRREGERRLQAHLARRESLQREFADYFESKAREILVGREVTIETTGGAVRARLIRFRNGAVLESEHVSPSGTGHGRTRIEQKDLADAVPPIVSYLTQAVLSLGPDARPRD
jgi:hypothetical protein